MRAVFFSKTLKAYKSRTNIFEGSVKILLAERSVQYSKRKVHKKIKNK